MRDSIGLPLNNLPAASLLAARTPGHPFALLIGLNLGPNLFVTGSLAWLLWLRAARDTGAQPSIAHASRIGVVAARCPWAPHWPCSPSLVPREGLGRRPESRSARTPGDRFDPVTLASVGAFHTRSVATASYHADAVLRICRQYAPSASGSPGRSATRPKSR